MKARSPGKPVSLDEVVVITKYDNNNLTFEQMEIWQDFLARKTKHEEMRRELQQKKVLQKIKDIFLEAFDVKNLDENALGTTQLVHIVEKIHNDDIDANDKLV